MSGWYRFEQVTQHIPAEHTLYRASSPNYSGGDATQNLTAASVKFLTDSGIDSVVSLNQHRYVAAAADLLRDADIAYLHVPVVDFTAPTLAQLRGANAFFLQHKATLVHCGYGHGRTGTAVTALQLAATGGAEPAESLWSRNHVETEEQRAVLRQFRDSLKIESQQ